MILLVSRSSIPLVLAAVALGMVEVHDSARTAPETHLLLKTETSYIHGPAYPAQQIRYTAQHIRFPKKEEDIGQLDGNPLSVSTEDFHFFSYGDKAYTDALTRLETEVAATGLFPAKNIHIYRSLPDAILGDKRWRWHLSQTKGHGYWFWKAALVSHLFRTAVPKGGSLVYVDAGCDISSTRTAMKMWNALMEKMSSRDLIAFQLDGNHLLEQMWTKGDVFARFGTTPEDPYYGTSRQAVGGYFIIKNSAASNEFLEKWLTLMSDQNLITNAPSLAKSSSNFKENRHDQSVWSMLIKANEPETRCAMTSNVSRSRNAEWGVAGLKVSLIHDIGYPPSPCSPFSASRNHLERPAWGETIDESSCENSKTSVASKCLGEKTQLQQSKSISNKVWQRGKTKPNDTINASNVENIKIILFQGEFSPFGMTYSHVLEPKRGNCEVRCQTIKKRHVDDDDMKSADVYIRDIYFSGSPGAFAKRKGQLWFVNDWFETAGGSVGDLSKYDGAMSYKYSKRENPYACPSFEVSEKKASGLDFETATDELYGSDSKRWPETMPLSSLDSETATDELYGSESKNGPESESPSGEIGRTRKYSADSKKYFISWLVSNCGMERDELARYIKGNISRLLGYEDNYLPATIWNQPGACDTHSAPARNRSRALIQRPSYASANDVERAEQLKGAAVVGDSMFYLAFENRRCQGYITEKVNRALAEGAVPIVFGGFNKTEYEDRLPPHSYISTDDFAGPQELAKHLLEIRNNSSKYAQYHAWRGTYRTVEGCHHALCNLCKLAHGKMPALPALDWNRLKSPKCRN